MLFLIGLIIPFFSFLLQIYPRFFNRYFGVDVWSRLVEARLIRKNHHKIPMNKIRDQFLIPGYFNYPPLFPWFLSFIPDRKLIYIQGFIAPIFDVMQNFLVFLISLQLTGRLEMALFAQLIYASIPLTILENSYLTPRSLGYLNFTLAFYPVLLYSVAPHPFYLFIGFIFTVCIFFTHRFAAQSLLFINIFFSILERNPLYIGVFVTCFIIAIVISRGYYLRVLRGHIANILFWVHNAQFRFAHQIRGIVSRKIKTDFVGKIYYYLGTFAPATLVGTNLWLVPTFLFIGDKMFGLHLIPLENLLLMKMSIWAIFFYVFSFVILSSTRLTPIGEGQRYLEMGTVPTAIVSAFLFSSMFQTEKREIALAVFLTIFFINLLLTIFIQWKGVIQDKNRSMTKDMDRIFVFLKHLNTPKILCIPHQITTMILYNTHAKILVDIEAGTLEKINDVFPILKKPVKEIAKKYDLNILVLKKYYATMEELKLPKKSLLLETEDTQVIKI